MYANPGTKWVCPITIHCRNQLTIQTLTLKLPAIMLRPLKKTKEEKLNKIYYTQVNTTTLFKSMVKVQARNSNKAIESS